MPVWVWIVIAVIVLLIVVLLVLIAQIAARRKKTAHLKETFGSEYQRAVNETGQQRAAEDELLARQRKREKLDIIPLSRQARDRYATRWQTVQTAFVDNPSSAVRDADELISEVMRERGYPIDDFDQRAADISVDHPDVAENYRAAHRIHLSQREHEIGTEEQRQAFVHYRALFDKLLAADGQPETDQGKDSGKDSSEEARA